MAVSLATVVICSSQTVTDYHDYHDGGQGPDLHQLMRFQQTETIGMQPQSNRAASTKDILIC